MNYQKCLDGKIIKLRKLIARLYKIHYELNNLSDFIREDLEYINFFLFKS